MIVGGSSVLNGAGQSPRRLWTRALARRLGREFVVINLALRAGGGYDGVRDNGYFSVGVSAVSEVGAIDFALQRDISGDGKATIAAISARLFVPTQ